MHGLGFERMILGLTVSVITKNSDIVQILPVSAGVNYFSRIKENSEPDNDQYVL